MNTLAPIIKLAIAIAAVLACLSLGANTPVGQPSGVSLSPKWSLFSANSNSQLRKGPFQSTYIEQKRTWLQSGTMLIARVLPNDGTIGTCMVSNDDGTILKIPPSTENR